MDDIDFDAAFRALTGNPPFPWQRALYAGWFSQGKFPASCNLPTGLGKTSVIAVWLIALANRRAVPRRLVYVVNRRTVVDQTTDEVEKYARVLAHGRAPLLPELIELSARLRGMSAVPESGPLAISTLRGQFADNREWSADPSRPAVICGTVDMIGSRLLFSGYGCGFKTRPLHAGFLGQDALIVHDEAHLEPAFQTLIEAIRDEQKREAAPLGEWTRLKVMELTATSRAGATDTFELTDADKSDSVVKQRINAKKTLRLHENEDDKKLAEEIVRLALKYKDLTPGPAVLVFVRKVEDVEKVTKKLPAKSFEQLTGTLRGLERDGLLKKPIFQRFLPNSNRAEGVTPQEGTVYLVCTSAGEVGVNISADHLVCDLSTYESMAQRFGRVNRFGDLTDTEIHVVHPKTFDAKDEFSSRLKLTLGLLELLNGDASPSALTSLRERAIEEGATTDPASTDRVKALRDYVKAHRDTDPRLGGFAPPPTILTTSDILFDAWALTTINKPLVKQKLPGRPPVEPYLHGVAEWQPPETHVAWREEVERITGDLLAEYEPEVLLDAYPLKPHEKLRDNSARVFLRLTKLKAAADTPVWLVSDDDSVKVTTLGKIVGVGKEEIEGKTVLLPPSAGGLEGGFLTSDSPTADDVSERWYADAANTIPRRVRQWDETEPPDEMRLILTIDTKPGADESEEEATGRRFWRWYELRQGGDDVGIKNSKRPVSWETHTKDVLDHTKAIVGRLPLADLGELLVLAAECHDLGKRRKLFQTVLGNRDYPNTVLAKSGKKGGRVEERYRHEFGSLLDTEAHDLYKNLSPDKQMFVLHLIAAHHGRGRPHFPSDEAFDPEPRCQDVSAVASAVPQRFAALQRKYGRWGLAYLESLLRAADYAASGRPSKFEPEDGR